MSLLIRQDGIAEYFPAFIPAGEAQACFKTLRAGLDWRREWLCVRGRQVAAPRLVCWYGDAGAVYCYSGVRHEPLPWVPQLWTLKTRLETAVGFSFNSVLGNLYRNGQDAMGWHADKERELGREPVIASLSFGAPRLFKLRHNKSKETVDMVLGDGDLLIMRDRLQQCWRHCLPKTRRPVGERINLTFRLITPLATVGEARQRNS
ncbi:MAG TPA: alpha-ketoglutarate-dependent dioxygenase AlkB [Gammaproteobacteria bacterium]|nr:alpha-ketoglutarate-dependent dioxygenase AlkB [Gammaproteobacteria bacterium]